MKPTFYPVLAFYFLVKRQYKLVICSIITAAISTLGPLIISGRPIIATLQEMWFSFGQVSSYSMNNPSPFFIHSVALQNLSPLIFRLFNQYSVLTNTISWLVILGLFGVTFYLVSKNRADAHHSLLDISLVSMFTFLIIYHRNYESFLVIPGIFYVYLKVRAGSINKDNWVLLVIFTTILGIKLLPSNTIIVMLGLTPFSYESYLVRLIAPIHAWANLLIFGILLGYKIRQVRGKPTPKIITETIESRLT